MLAHMDSQGSRDCVTVTDLISALQGLRAGTFRFS